MEENRREIRLWLCGFDFLYFRVVVLLGHPRPSVAGIGVPRVLTGTRVSSRQSATGVVLKSCVLDVVGEMCCRAHSVRCWN